MNAGGRYAYNAIDKKYIKVTHNKDTRRLKARNNFEEMKAHVAKTFKMSTNAKYLSYMYFKYKDSEGDVTSKRRRIIRVHWHSCPLQECGVYTH